MKQILFLLIVCGFSSAAFAKSSACVLYADNSETPVRSQYSCDGADIADLYKGTGLSAVLSKSIPYFLDKGYTLVNCSDANSSGGEHGTNSAYQRCTFVMK